VITTDHQFSKDTEITYFVLLSRSKLQIL